MKKKIKAIALAAVMSLGMTCGMAGCGDDDDKGGGGGSLSTVGESTYILISTADRIYTSSERIEKGQGVQKALEKCGEAEDENKPYIVGSMVYFNDGKFKLFDGTQMDAHRVVSGNYSIGGGDEVKFENNRVDVENLKNGKKSYYDLTTDTSENLSKFALEGTQKDLKTMNEGNCMFKCPNPPSFVDDKNSNGFSAPKALYTGKGEFEQYGGRTPNPNGYKLYSKGDYLVCKQNSYTFKNKPGDSNFVIKCENTNYSYTYNMHNDGTWDGKVNDQYDLRGGTWEQRDNNIIAVSSPDSVVNVDAYLYLDYSDNEIYLPIYMKCNDFLDIAKNAK